MKKSIILTLALVFVLGIAGTAFAANPFVDVPAKHWAYDAVAKLAQAGIVDGYGDGTFKGDKTMTRYEMAQVVAKAMARSDKADAEQKAMIDKLSVEFSTELNNMGVRVAALEKKAAADSVNITGYARIRYEANDFSKVTGSPANSQPLTMRSRLFVSGQINQDWKYMGRLETNYDLRSTNSSDQGVYLNNAYVTGPVAGTTATFGRYDIVTNYGLMLDSELNGAKFAFGNKVKTNVYYGKNIGATTTTGGNNPEKNLTLDDKIIAVDFSYAATKDLNLKAAYYNVKNDSNTMKFKDQNGNRMNTVNAWELGFDYNLSQDWKFKANYGRTNADKDNTALLLGLDYKAADKKKVNSFGAWVNYRDFKAYGTLDTTFDLPFATNAANTGNRVGGKGYEVGFSYVPMLNTVFTTKYVDVKATADGNSDKANYYMARFEFWF